jgi:hypothetical protein
VAAVVGLIAQIPAFRAWVTCLEYVKDTRDVPSSCGLGYDDGVLQPSFGSCELDTAFDIEQELAS